MSWSISQTLPQGCRVYDSNMRHSTASYLVFWKKWLRGNLFCYFQESHVFHKCIHACKSFFLSLLMGQTTNLNDCAKLTKRQQKKPRYKKCESCIYRSWGTPKRDGLCSITWSSVSKIHIAPSTKMVRVIDHTGKMVTVEWENVQRWVV